MSVGALDNRGRLPTLQRGHCLQTLPRRPQASSLHAQPRLHGNVSSRRDQRGIVSFLIPLIACDPSWIALRLERELLCGLIPVSSLPRFSNIPQEHARRRAGSGDDVYWRKRRHGGYLDRTVEEEASEEAVFSSQQAGDLFQMLLSSGPATHGRRLSLHLTGMSLVTR
jgi:hypothetical protein